MLSMWCDYHAGIFLLAVFILHLPQSIASPTRADAPLRSDAVSAPLEGVRTRKWGRRQDSTGQKTGQGRAEQGRAGQQLIGFVVPAVLHRGSSGQMSVMEELQGAEGAELLGLLFPDEDPRVDEDLFFSDGKNLMEDLLSDQDILSAMETEDFLSQLLGEEDDSFAAPCVSLSPLGSDSGISDGPSDGPSSSPHSEPECLMEGVTKGVAEAEGVVECYEAQVVETDHCYALLSVRTDQPDTDVFIDLNDLDESVSPGVFGDLPCSLTIEESTFGPQQGHMFQFKDNVLTDEEKRLLAKEGLTIPSHMPLTKAEERSLKRVRRKIRNKQSAQESRKKKKVYVDGLENRVSVCTAHNQELQKKVELLQKQNMSLVEQLRKLQAIVKISTMKTSTTSTCVMVFLLSFCLIIFPSINPFGNSAENDLYASTGMSRSLRSYPMMPKGGVIISSSEVKVDVEVELNQMPDYQQLDQSDSETAINSNSSSDFPPSAIAHTHTDPAAPPVVYDGQSAEKESWLEQTATAVIIPQRRSDEM